MADKQFPDPTFELVQLYQELEWKISQIDFQLWRGCRRRQREQLEDERITLEEKLTKIEQTLVGEDVSIWADLEATPFREKD